MQFCWLLIEGLHITYDTSLIFSSIFLYLKKVCAKRMLIVQNYIKSPPTLPPTRRIFSLLIGPSASGGDIVHFGNHCSKETIKL